MLFIWSPSVQMATFCFGKWRQVGEGKVWPLSARKEVASLAGHKGIVYSVAFSPDGQHFVSASEDRLIKMCRS